MNNIDEIRQRGKDDLYFLCKHILGYSELQPDPHSSVMCNFAEKVEAQPKNKRKGLLQTPRGSFKSSVLTIGRTIKLIINDPNVRVLISSETYTNAASYLEAVKSHLRDKKFIKIYGDMISEATTDREGDLTISTRTKHFKENTVECTGVAKAKTGMHYDHIIHDDLVSRDNIMTAEQIVKVIDYWKLCFALLDPGGTCTTVGTCWHQDDLYDYIKTHLAEHQVIEVHPAIYKDGRYFFPEVLDKDFLDEQKIILGPSKFAAQYMNDPLPSEDMVFKPEYIRWIGMFKEGRNGKPILPDPHHAFIFVDPSMGQNPGNDSHGIIVLVVDVDNNWIIADAIQQRLTPSAAGSIIIELVRVWDPIYVVYETQGIGNGLKPGLEELATKQGVVIPFHEIPTSSNISKIIRIQSLEPAFANLQICLPFDNKDQLWGGHKDLYDSITRFRTDRRPKKCDALDALANAPSIAFPPVENKGVKKKRQDFDHYYEEDDETEEWSRTRERDPIGDITGVY